MKKSFLVIIPLFSFLAILPLQCQKTVSGGGVFKTGDMAETWEQLARNDQEVPIISLDVLSLTVNPADSSVIYLGSRDRGIYKSCSGGSHWYRLVDENNALSSRANVYDIAIDPKDPGRVYIGVYQDKKGRVFRSQDGGESWEETYVVSQEEYAVFAVEVDNFEPSTVYIGTAQGGLLKSTDYGKSWETMNWFDDVISDIAINPLNTQEVYVSTFRKGIYKTADKGETWESFEEKIEEFRAADKVENLVIDAKRPAIVYAGSEYGVLTTKDAGRTWSAVNIIMPPESRPVLSLAVESDNTDHLYYGAGPALYRSIDQGKNWTVHELPSNRAIKAIAIDPKNPQVIYLGMHEEE